MPGPCASIAQPVAPDCGPGAEFAAGFLKTAAYPAGVSFGPGMRKTWPRKQDRGETMHDSETGEQPEILPLGADGLLVRFSTRLEDAANRAVLELARRLDDDGDVLVCVQELQRDVERFDVLGLFPDPRQVLDDMVFGNPFAVHEVADHGVQERA